MQISSFATLKWSLLAAAAVGMMLAGCRPAETAATNEPGTSAPEGGTETAGREMPTANAEEPTGDTLKIGLVASQNGDLRPWGADSVYGARLAISEINDAGGVNGKKVELLVEDSNSSPEQGKTAAEKLGGSGIQVMVGEVASGITRQMADVAFSKGIPLIAVGATNPDITKGKANIFRVCYTDDLQGPVMAKFAFEELGLKKIAVLTDQAQPYSVGLSASFVEKFKALGGEIVSQQDYKSKDTQFGAQLTNLRQFSPDGMFLSGYFNEVGPIVKQAVQAGLKNVKFLGGDGWDSKEILTNGGEAIVGSYFCNHYNNEDERAEVKNFLSKWKAKYAVAPGTTMGALAYDSVMLAADAMKRAKTLDGKGITEALEATEAFRGVSGDITLKGNQGNPPKRAIVVELTPDGQKFAKAYEAPEVK
jgi:branched-chain amino acid transport system substrate-binding protein